jgi:tetratricopeptide (TPR) repeat protein
MILVFYIVSLLSFKSIDHDSRYKIQESSLFRLPVLMVKVIAGEFKGIFSDFSIMEAGSIIGKRESKSSEEWDSVAKIFGVALELDPYFQQSYMLIQGTLPWNTKNYDETFTLLNKSKDHRFWDWIPGFFIGFDYFFFLNDYEKSSEYLMGASTVNNAPPALATFAARMAQESGKNQLAISFLEMMISKEYDPVKKELLLTRIQAHKAVALIEGALQEYKLVFGEYPQDLSALIHKGFIQKLPENPYGRPFEYKSDDGSIKY